MPRSPSASTPRIPVPRTGRSPRAGRDPRDWLKQFEPVEEGALDENQRRFLHALRRLYTDGRAGLRRADGRLYFYAADANLGYFAGLMPDKNEAAHG